MTETARLVIAVDSTQARSATAELSNLERSSKNTESAVLRLASSGGLAVTQLSKVQEVGRSAANSVSGLGEALKATAGLLGAAFSVREVAAAADEYANLTNRLRLVTEGAVQLAAAQDAVFSAAQASRQSLETTASVYQRVAQNGKQLGLSFADVASITETIAKSVALSGASAQAAEAALTQFGQALASGALRGDELNSIMEQTPALAQTIARGLGVSVGQLRAMGAEGELTSEKLIKALTGQKAAVDELATTMQVTGSQALTAFGNSLTQAIGKLDEAAGASNKFAGAILSMSRALDGFSSGEFSDFFRDNKETVAGLNSEIGTTLSRMRDLNTARAKLNPNDAGDTVLFNFKLYNREELDREIAGLSKRTDEARSTIEKMKKDAAGVSGQSPKGDAAGASVVNEAYEKQLKSLQKMAALQGDNTEVAKTRYAIEHGELGKLLPAQEELLLKYAREKDAKAASEAAVKKYGSAAEKAANQEKKALDSLLAQSAISTNSTNAMADAYLSGADSVRELAIQQKIEEELLKTGAGARDAVTAAVNREADAKDRLDVSKHTDDLHRETTDTLAQATATLQGADALETFNIQKSMSIALSGKKIDIGSKEYEQLLEQTKAQLAANKALEQASKVEGIIDRLNPQIKLLKDYTAERDALNAAMIRDSDNVGIYQDALVKLGNEYEVNRSKATIWGQMTEGAIDRIDEAFASAWGNIGSGAESLWDNLKKGFKQTLGEIAHMLTTKPLLASISNWLTGTDNGQGVSSVWGKLLGSVGGSSGSGGSGGGLFSGLAGIGKNLYSAWNTLTGVGSSVASGYASGGVSGALSGGASYYGNMLSNIGSTLSNGFSSLVSTFTGVTAAQTAATIGAQGVTSAVLSGAVTEGATAIGAQFTTGVATTTAATYAAAEAGAAATAASIGGQISAAMSSAAAMWPLAIVMGMYQSGKLYSAGVRPDASAMWDSAGSTGLGKAAMLPQTVGAKYFEVTDNILGKVVGGKMAAILSGSTLFQAVWTAVGGKLFGTGYKTKDMGIELGVEGGVFDAQQYTKQKKKGGWLSGSSKTRYLYSALDAETEDALGSAYNEKILNSMGLFSALGVQLSDSVLDGLNVAATQISTQNKTPEAIQAEINAWFGMLGDSAVAAINAATASGLDGFTFDGLTSFVNNLYEVNSVFDKFGVKMVDFTVAGGRAVESLAAIAGGMDALRTNISSYYDNFTDDTQKASDNLAAITQQFAALGLVLPGTRDAYKDMLQQLDMTGAHGQAVFNAMTLHAESAAAAYAILEQRESDYYGAFYSESENAARATKETTERLKELGVTLPDSRDGFRDMVEALDQTTVTGKAMYDTLMSVAGAAGTVFDALDAKSKAGVTNSFSALQRAISAQQKAATEAYNATTSSLNDTASAATENVSGLTSVGNDLSAALKALRGDSDDAVKMLRAQAQATLQSALATARSGGSLSGFTGLSDALDTVSSNNTDLYGSMEDFARDQGRTANVVAELNGLNGKQLTTAEKSLAGLKEQIDLAKDQFDEEMAKLDRQLELAQAQMDALNGVDTSVMGVTAAINAMSASVVAALGAIRFPASSNTPQNNATLIDTLYQSVLGRDASDTTDAAGKAHWAAQIQSGSISYADVAAKLAQSALGFSSVGYTGDVSQATIDSSKAAAQAYLDSLKVPGFATGGDFGGGLRLVGENGPELEVTGPSRIFNANQTASMLRDGGGDAALLSELKQMREENKSQRFQIAKTNQQVASLLQKWDAEGAPKERDYAQ